MTQKRPYCEFDLECDHHWFLAKFMLPDGRMFSHTISAESDVPFPVASVQWFIDNFTLVGFNSENYDIPMLSLAMAGADVFALKRLNDEIIVGGLKRWHFFDLYRHVQPLQNLDHVDIMEVAPGVRIGLKTYGGRMHAPTLQDLPFDPSAPMPVHMRAVTDDYCGNDLRVTRQLREACQERLDLREAMSARYGVDLRSKSDAQMAEGIIKAQLPFKPAKRIVPHGYRFQYVPPDFIQYSTPQMSAVLQTVRNAWFVVNDVDQVKDRTGLEEVLEPDGKKMRTGVQMPRELKALQIAMGESRYQFGIGGLHSTESSISHHTSIGRHTISDHDVASYYPSMILLLQMVPEQLGPAFLEIYDRVYRERLAAKASGDKTTADGLKITLNGSFGKLFSKYSILFAPELGIRVTLTGQLALLMLIESLEACGIRVVSANTDGIVVRTPSGREWLRDGCIKHWESATGLQMEATFYRSIYMRDVNNYVAIKLDGKVKGKGAFAESGVLNNVHPERDVCCDAVIAYLKNGTPLEQTIRACTDLRRFLIIRNVKGGGYDAAGNYLGKTVRWYYAAGESGALRYKTKPDGKPGNIVAGSTGARPCMVLPDAFPGDVDYANYLQYAEKMLQSLGANR